MTKVHKNFEEGKRKRIINPKECEFELREILQRLFNTFWNAVRLYESEISLTPIQSRCRGFEANYLNSKIIQCIQAEFEDEWFFGKYNRFIFRINGYIILFKKLNKKDMPMNIPTKYSLSLTNQQQGSLFDKDDNGSEPILFFGYNKNRFGEIINPKVVYIDENEIRSTIT